MITKKSSCKRHKSIDFFQTVDAIYDRAVLRRNTRGSQTGSVLGSQTAPTGFVQSRFLEYKFPANLMGGQRDATTASSRVFEGARRLSAVDPFGRCATGCKKR